MRRVDLGRATVGVVAAALLAGCGTTVSSDQVGAGTSAAAVDGGLGVPSPSASAGSSVPGTGDSGTDVGSGVVGSGGSAVPRGTSSSTGAGTTPGGSGGAHVTGPVSLGLLYTVNDGAAPAGIDNGNSITPSQAMHAYVASWNHSGGLDGRTIKPVYFAMHSYNNDYEQQIAAACAAFTQDNHVAAVVMELQYYSEQLLTCLGRAGVPLFSGDFTAPDRQDAHDYPLLITPMTQLGEDREASVVRHLADDGFLSSRSHVGVIVEDCPVDERIYDNGVVPALRGAHVPLASTFRAQCFQSLQDFGAQTSQMSSAVLQFRRAGVDRVMVVSAGAEANIVFAFSEVAENQGYRPGYALSSVAIPVALELNAAPAQMQNMRGVGWLPVLDATSRDQSPPTAAGQSCLDRLGQQGVSAKSQADRWTAYSACEGFLLYDAVLRATSGNTDASAVLGAVPSVVSSKIAAATIGAHLGVSGGRVVPTTGRVFAYDSKDQFHYVGGTFRL